MTSVYNIACLSPYPTIQFYPTSPHCSPSFTQNTLSIMDPIEQSFSASLSPQLSTPASSSAPPSSSAEIIPATPLPTSVRGAPEELKPAIRKKQNKESARRSRRRRKELIASLSKSLRLMLSRTKQIEDRLAHMENFCAAMGFIPLPPLSPLPQLPGLLGIEAGGDDGKEEAMGTGQEHKDLHVDDEVENLIEKCMGQI